MHQSQKLNLRRNHVALVQGLDPKDTCDQLQEDGILSESDCQRICTGETIRERCRILLEILPRRGPQAYGSFKRALKQNYPHLNELLPEETSIDLDSDGVSHRVCSDCRPFLPKHIAEERLRDSITQNCCEILENLEANDVLDCFYQECILDSDDVENIKSEKTRKDRCAALIRRISQCRDSKVFSVFLISLRENYVYIANKLDALRGQPFKQPYEAKENDFNSLSTLINEGDYQQFQRRALEIRQSNTIDTDLMCVIDYLHACRYLHTSDGESAEKHINPGLMLAQKTGYPTFYTLELLTCQTRMYRQKQKLGELQSTLDDAKMIIEADPTYCTGRGAGWLYLNDVDFIMVRMTMLNSSAFSSAHEQLEKQAIDSCKKSMDHFKHDKGNDGPFGFGIALCRLVTLLLRCGIKCTNMDNVRPNPYDVKLAGRYLRKLENSDIPFKIFLKAAFLLAKSDYHFRRDHKLRALEYAKESLDLSTENNILEFKEQAEDRVNSISAKISSS